MTLKTASVLHLVSRTSSGGFSSQFSGSLQPSDRALVETKEPSLFGVDDAEGTTEGTFSGSHGPIMQLKGWGSPGLPSVLANSSACRGA